jgi:lysophospholipase L1-like esterase
MQNKLLFVPGIVVFMALGTLCATAQQVGREGAGRTDHCQRIIKDNDRIVFVGDSITGNGVRGGKGGWVALIGEGLRLDRPNANQTLTGLGGSGATVGAWLNFEKRSRTESVVLDVKDIDVGKTLDAGAEVVIVMLGMNDVLAPSLKNQPADFDAWAIQYAQLIEVLRARSHPRVIALATVTPCTEDPASPKNRVLAELNARVVTLARQKNLPVLPTSEASYEVQALGRAYCPYYHVTADFVHPNAAGHLAIAVGMLRGLGEPKAAQKLLAHYARLYQPAADKFPTLSYSLLKSPSSPEDATHRFAVTYQWTSTAAETPPRVQAIVPQGWKVSPASLTAAKGRFELAGPLDRLENKITLSADAGGETRQQVIAIPAGWRIAVGGGRLSGWTANSVYDPNKDRQPLDERLAQGDGFAAAVPFPAGAPAAWRLAVASDDYTGLGRPGSVDMAAIAFFRYSSQAYGARWIYSPKERPVQANLSRQCFALNSSLDVWLNGKPVYQGKIGQATAAAALQQGWNLLVFRSYFIAWQWQFSIDLAGHEGDDLSDLRYATTLPDRAASGESRQSR